LCDRDIATKVGEFFVRFYQQFLGTSKDTLPLDVDVVRCSPRLYEASHVFLLAAVSNEDFKKALFCIGNDKSPRLDGYSCLFFEKYWDVVWEYLCVVVHDFFVSGKLLK
jgi:hypothetical protein